LVLHPDQHPPCGSGSRGPLIMRIRNLDLVLQHWYCVQCTHDGPPTLHPIFLLEFQMLLFLQFTKGETRLVCQDDVSRLRGGRLKREGDDIKHGGQATLKHFYRSATAENAQCPLRYKHKSNEGRLVPVQFKQVLIRDTRCQYR